LHSETEPLLFQNDEPAMRIRLPGAQGPFPLEHITRAGGCLCIRI
jgi:hypothetical protein